MDRIFIFRTVLGNLSNVNSFRFGYKTGSYFSCSTVIEGKITIFGGHASYDYSDQITSVKECGLTRVGTLPIKFDGGSCNTYQRPRFLGRTHKFENIVIFRSGNLYSLCNPGNQHYQPIIYFLIFSSKRSKSAIKVW